MQEIDKIITSIQADLWGKPTQYALFKRLSDLYKETPEKCETAADLVPHVYGTDRKVDLEGSIRQGITRLRKWLNTDYCVKNKNYLTVDIASDIDGKAYRLCFKPHLLQEPMPLTCNETYITVELPYEDEISICPSYEALGDVGHDFSLSLNFFIRTNTDPVRIVEINPQFYIDDNLCPSGRGQIFLTVGGVQEGDPIRFQPMCNRVENGIQMSSFATVKIDYYHFKMLLPEGMTQVGWLNRTGKFMLRLMYMTPAHDRPLMYTFERTVSLYR